MHSAAEFVEDPSRKSDIDKPGDSVVGRVDSLEQYLDDYLSSVGQTFEEWIRRFGEGAYYQRNQVIVDLLAHSKPKRIFEFACAAGFLAESILKSIPGVERYSCTNYSIRVVDYCRRQLQRYPQCDVALINADVVSSNDISRCGLSGYDVFLTTGFEHIEHDLDLIRALPRESCFVFCVAGFDDPEHFRLFSSADQIRDRYDLLLRIENIVELGEEPAKKYVVLAHTK